MENENIKMERMVEIVEKLERKCKDAENTIRENKKNERTINDQVTLIKVLEDQMVAHKKNALKVSKDIQFHEKNLKHLPRH